MAIDKYDELIKKSINTKNLIIKEKDKNNREVESAYFNETYRNSLINSMSEKERILFKNELEMHWKEKYKMCSVASSSRLCYLLYKYNNDKYDFENTSLNNDGCSPHYDAHCERNNIYVECKCHELRNKPTSKLQYYPYHDLIKKYFDIDCNKQIMEIEDKDGNKKTTEIIEPKYSDFNIIFDKNKLESLKENNDPSIYDLKFDFKQMLCHILGLLTLNSKPTLKYNIFVPKEELIEKSQKSITKWYEEMQYIVNTIISSIKNTKVNIDGKHVLSDCINFEVDYICVSDVNDFVLENV